MIRSSNRGWPAQAIITHIPCENQLTRSALGLPTMQEIINAQWAVCAQVSMKLKLGQMWDHNGTYMDGIGFKHQDHEVVIEQAAGDIMHGE